MPRLATLCVFGLLVPSAVGAETRFKRNPRAPAMMALSERVAPPAKTTPATELPTLSIDVAFSNPLNVGNIRTEQEQILANLINNTPDSEHEEKADYFFRLGELYARQCVYWQTKAKELQGKNARDAASAADKAKMYLLKAVKTYKGLTENDAFKNYPKLDMALFFYGFTLQTGKYMKEARMVYDKLLKNFPQSKYVPEAHLAFAEYYFEAGQLADAEARYGQVRKFPKSTASVYALYQLGVIDAKLERHADALDKFTRTVQETAGTRALATIHDAATRAVARAATKVGPDKALAAMGQNKTAEVVAALATQYFEQGQFDSASKLYRDALRSSPKNVLDVCHWNHDLFRSMLGIPTAKRADQVQQAEALVTAYVATKRIAMSDDERSDCRENAAAVASEMARAIHLEASASKNAEALAQADRLYRTFLTSFPESEDRTAVSADYGELLWLRADSEKNAKTRTALWEQAADAFTLAADDSDNARAMILAWKNALDFDATTLTAKIDLARSTKSKAAKPQKLPLKIAKLVGVSKAVVTALDANDPEVAQFQLLIASQLRQYHHDEEAIDILEHFLDDHHDSEHGEAAATLLLDSLARTRQFDDLNEIVDLLATDTKFISTKPNLVKNLQLLRTKTAMARGR